METLPGKDLRLTGRPADPLGKQTGVGTAPPEEGAVRTTSFEGKVQPLLTKTAASRSDSSFQVCKMQYELSAIKGIC